MHRVRPPPAPRLHHRTSALPLLTVAGMSQKHKVGMCLIVSQVLTLVLWPWGPLPKGPLGPCLMMAMFCSLQVGNQCRDDWAYCVRQTCSLSLLLDLPFISHSCFTPSWDVLWQIVLKHYKSSSLWLLLLHLNCNSRVNSSLYTFKFKWCSL